jgi:hypothetical protein
MALARNRDIPIFVVGIGTSSGGLIPVPRSSSQQGAKPPATQAPPIHSTLDRESLSAIAAAAGGQYFEIGRQSDRDIANRIVGAARRRAGSLGIETAERELYWQLLFAAAILLGTGTLFMQERTELWLSAVGTAAVLAIVWSVTN